MSVFNGKFIVLVMAVVVGLSLPVSPFLLAAEPEESEEELVDFGAEERADEAESAAIQAAALGQAAKPDDDKTLAADKVTPEADSEEEVDFGAEEEADEAESAAIQAAALGQAAKPDDDKTLAPDKAAPEADSEEEVDFGAEEEADEAESAAIQAAAGAGHGLAETQDVKTAQLNPEQKKQAEDLAFWRQQPYPELEYSGWMAVGPGLLLLWAAFQVPWRKRK